MSARLVASGPIHHQGQANSQAAGGTDRAVDGGLHARNAEMPTGTALVVCGGVWSLTACGLLSLCLA